MTCTRRPIQRWGFWLVTVVTFLVAAHETPLRAQRVERTPATYTVEQADAGLEVYTRHCSSCHGKNLDDGPFAPPLRGVEFQARWHFRSLEALFDETSATMPQDRPGSLTDEAYVQLLAFVLQENGIRPDDTALPIDLDALAALSPGWSSSGGGLSAGIALPTVPVRRNPLDSIRPVTDAMLENAEPEDWLLWRRTYDASGYSPLDHINTTNVDDLRVAWSWSLPPGPNESTPIVHDGTLFVHGYGDKVYALDAASGDLLWRYARRLPRDRAPSLKRGMSIYGERLYVPTSDVHVVALDVKTGSVVWDQAIADDDSGAQRRLTGGTLVAKGKVMVGTTGRAKGGNYIVALDADTGNEAWRFNTIPPPALPGGNSWNGLPHDERNGGSVWIPGSYDPVNNLAFFGPGNTYDTAPLRDPVHREGITNDGLYLDTTLALNPDTGELVWHFQHQANGQWDLDWAFERQIMDLPVNGVPTSVVVTAGKQAIFDIVETKTGMYVSSIDLGLQNGITAIDQRTGRKTVDPALIPGDGETKMVCPHVGGGRSWSPTAYDPETKIAYVPIVEACMDMIPVADGERGSLSTGVRWTVRPRPESDGSYGRLEAINLETHETEWITRQRAPQTTGALVTGGGLLFAGSLDRRFSAYDASTGDRLWHTRLNDIPNAPPITFVADGRQYVAVTVGAGGYLTAAYSALAPEIVNPPDRGAALWVFEVSASR
jgi:alcohol dehydrogenase (cytochrome c)